MEGLHLGLQRACRYGYGVHSARWAEFIYARTLSKLLKSRITRWGFLAVLLLAAGATVAGMHQRQYQLGGGFIGSGAAGIWSALQIPIDPAGKTAALRVNVAAFSEQFAGLFAALGATGDASDAIGEVEMISRDTGKYKTLSYAVAAVPGNPRQINSIHVMTGTVKFTDCDTIEVTYTINVYPVNLPATSPFYGYPNTDVNGDGYPDPRAQPIVISGVLPIQGVDIAKRVTLR
jgi:hypothetical protein